MNDNKRLQSIRMRMGLTQRKLAKRLRLTQSAISHWERGLSYPSVTIAGKIVKLAEKFGIYCTVESLRTK